MSTAVKIYPSPPPPKKRSHFFSFLRQLGNRALHSAALRSLHPLVWRVRAVTEPARCLSSCLEPTTTQVQERESITLVTANLWHDWPRHRALPDRLETFASLIEAEQADILLLQEVTRTVDLHVDEWLQRRLGMAFVYSRANGHRGAIGFEEGLAVFSRFPLKAMYLQQLGGVSRSLVRRVALGASIETPFGNILAVSVHLGLMRSQNRRQLAHLQNWVAEIAGQGTVFIGGDFNTAEHTSHLTQTRQNWLDIFRALNPCGNGTTHALRGPWGTILRRQRLDYIFLKPGNPRWEAIEARLLEVPGVYLSDHRPVLARLSPVD